MIGHSSFNGVWSFQSKVISIQVDSIQTEVVSIHQQSRFDPCRKSILIHPKLFENKQETSNCYVFCHFISAINSTSHIVCTLNKTALLKRRYIKDNVIIFIHCAGISQGCQKLFKWQAVNK